MEELRTIFFSREELELAISEHQKRTSAEFRLGSIRALRLEDSPPSATISIANVRGDHRAVVFSERDILDAMIEFCLKRKVPLPMRSSKRIEIQGDRAALVIEVSGKRLDKEAPSEAGPPWLPRPGLGIGRPMGGEIR